MKNRTFGLILGSFLVLSSATPALCMSRLGALGALAAATVATRCQKAETFRNNTNSFNGNTDRFIDGGSVTIFGSCNILT